jgi:predicted deacylase
MEIGEEATLAILNERGVVNREVKELRQSISQSFGVW